MMSTKIKDKILSLKDAYDLIKINKEALLNIIDDAELPECVFNSNAIENSTLTLSETEKILMDMEVSRELSIREIYEATNLARVTTYIRNHVTKDLTSEFMCLLHRMLIETIDDTISVRFRDKNEFVRIGSYIAVNPIQIMPKL